MFVPSKDKKGITITNAFQKVLDGFNRKLNNILVDQSDYFYNRSLKSWLHGDGVKMYLTLNKGKSVVAERFIRTLKSNMTAVSKKCVHQ